MERSLGGDWRCMDGAIRSRGSLCSAFDLLTKHCWECVALHETRSSSASALHGRLEAVLSVCECEVGLSAVIADNVVDRACPLPS